MNAAARMPDTKEPMISVNEGGGETARLSSGSSTAGLGRFTRRSSRTLASVDLEEFGDLNVWCRERTFDCSMIVSYLEIV